MDMEYIPSPEKVVLEQCLLMIRVWELILGEVLGGLLPPILIINAFSCDQSDTTESFKN